MCQLFHLRPPSLPSLPLSLSGSVLQKDYREAFSLFQEAASLRHAPATYMCGVCALYGHGLPVDYNAALLWFEQVDTTKHGRSEAKAKQKRSKSEAKQSISNGL